jgi:2-polyprenyl-3-methyl-5-hydroxy-6-metoxy-1,4-benzoquinol methylase
VATCHQCATGFTDATIDLSYYDRHYRHLAKYAAEPSVLVPLRSGVPNSEPEIAPRFDLAAQRIIRLLTDPGDRLLEIGCANGELLHRLAASGAQDVTGVDPSPESSEIARVHYGVDVKTGSISDMPGGLGTFDAVCLLGVLEHLWDTDGVIATVLDVLRPGGLLYIEVPNAARYTDPFASPFEDFNTEHVNHFSTRSLEVLAQRFGFQSIWQENIIGPLAPGVDVANIAMAFRRSSSDLNEYPRDVVADYDWSLREELSIYARRSLDQFNQIDELLEDALSETDEYILWGVGELSLKLLARPPLAVRRPAAMVDGNPTRQRLVLGGTQVTSPDELTSSSVPIVVASLIRGAAIRKGVSELGLQNPIISIQPSALIG